MLLLSSHLYFSALVWVAHGCGSSGGSSPGNSPSGMLLPQDGLPTGHSPSEMPPSSTRSLAVSPTLSPPYVSVISPAPMATTLCQQCVPGPMGVWELAGNGCGHHQATHGLLVHWHPQPPVQPCHHRWNPKRDRKERYQQPPSQRWIKRWSPLINISKKERLWDGSLRDTAPSQLLRHRLVPFAASVVSPACCRKQSMKYPTCSIFWEFLFHPKMLGYQSCSARRKCCCSDFKMSE